MRLLAGVVATLAGTTTLMGKLAPGPPDGQDRRPLGRMGAASQGGETRCLPPITVTGGPQGDRVHPAGGQRPGEVSNPARGTRGGGGDRGLRTDRHQGLYRADARGGRGEHLDRVERGRSGGSGSRSTLAPGAYRCRVIPPRRILAGRSVIVPGSLVTISRLDLSAERLGFIGVLRRMGATIEVAESGAMAGSVTSYTALLHGTVVEAAEIPSLDEVPILAVAAASAVGTTRFRMSASCG